MVAKIAVVGDSCIDEFSYGSASRLDPAAPAPVFIPSKLVSNPGMAGNVHRNLSNFKGISCSFYTNSNTIKKTRYIDERSNHLIVRIDVGDNETSRISKDILEGTNWEDFDAVIISDYNKGFLDYEDIKHIASINKNVFLDTKKLITEDFSKVRFIKINSHEFKISESNIKRIPGMFARVIVTTGSEGCRLGSAIYPVEKVEVKDTSGAGDTFLVGFVVKYLQTNNIYDSATFANKCATKVVTQRGVGLIEDYE